MITLVYFSTFILLVYLLQQSNNLPWQRSFWLFYTFIITYLLAVCFLWHSEDWLDVFFKTITLGIFCCATGIIIQSISKVIETYPSSSLQTLFTQSIAINPQEHQQQKSTQRLSLLVKQTPLAVIEWTTDFKVVDWNPAAEKIFGYGKWEALGCHGIELIVPESAREQVNLVWQQLLQQQGGTRSTNENFTKEGHKIYCEWYNTPLINAKGEVIGVASLVQDISERKYAEEALQNAKNELEIRVDARTQELKQALAELQDVIAQLQHEINQRQQVEAALREREEQYRSVVDNVKEVIFQTDANGLWTFLNPAWSEITGFAIAQTLGTPLLDYVHPDDRQCHWEQLQSLMERTQEYCFQAVRYITQDGTYRWVWVRGCLVFNEVGVVTNIAGIAEDITERKRAEAGILNALAKEKELSDLKSRFVSITSHEFRTPLTTIMSTAELLEYYDWTKEEELEQLHLIQDAVKQMLQLLEDVLCIGTAEAGQLQFNPKPLILNEFCQELVNQFQQGIRLRATPASPRHTLTFMSQGQSFLACMDRKLLGQLLNNLLSNAMKYSPSGGTIHFELVCQSEQAIFQIQDQGIGIPKEDQPRLFEFFHRAKNVGAITGTGLGLAIVKQCVDRHGGNITVKSDVGVGTLFIVTLPLNNYFSMAPDV